MIKRFLKALINRWGLYTRGQTGLVLGPSGDRLLGTLEESPTWKRDACVTLEGLTNLLATFPKRAEPWQVASLRSLLIFLNLIEPGRARLFVDLGDEPVPTLAAGLARALTDLQLQLPFHRAQAGSRIRELYLVELFDHIDEVAIPMGAINELTGHANPADLLYVAAMARQRGARRILEIGTYMGRTTYHLTFAADDAVVTTINLPPEQDARYAPFIGTYFRGRERERQIRQVFCDSGKLDVTPYRAAMDFIFIDGDHSYEGAKADTAKALEMLAPGGLIVWHDYAAKSPGVYRFAEEFSQQRPLFRVKKTCLLVYLDGVDVFAFRPCSMRESLERQELGAAA